MSELRVAFSVTSLKSNQYISLLLEGLEQCDVAVEKLSFWVVASNKVDVVHIHWPEHYLRKLTKFSHWRLLVMFLLTLLTAKINRIPVVWTVHNSWPHESSVSAFTLRAFFGIWLRSVDACIFMSDSTAREAQRLHPRLRRLPRTVIPHGDYKQLIDPVSKEDARAQLGLGDDLFVMSHCGIIKEYKNTFGLMKAFSELDGDELRLIVGGACKDRSLCSRLTAVAADDERILFKKDFLSEHEILVRVSAADLIVLPYKSVTNSGAALYALSVGRPVLAPEEGAFIDLHHQLPGWVYVYAGKFSTQVLHGAIDQIKAYKRGTEPDLTNFSWERVARKTAIFYGKLVLSDE